MFSKNGFSIRVDTKDRCYVFLTKTENERDKWLEVLKLHCVENLSTENVECPNRKQNAPTRLAGALRKKVSVEKIDRSQLESKKGRRHSADENVKTGEKERRYSEYSLSGPYEDYLPEVDMSTHPCLVSKTKTLLSERKDNSDKDVKQKKVEELEVFKDHISFTCSDPSPSSCVATADNIYLPMNLFQYGLPFEMQGIDTTDDKQKSQCLSMRSLQHEVENITDCLHNQDLPTYETVSVHHKEDKPKVLHEILKDFEFTDETRL